jgi:hypothetical protein
MKKSEMHAFIQVLYSVVIAVSFYQVLPDMKGHLVFIPPSEWLEFLKTREGFKFLLFLFTYIIAAHDWFSYHRNKQIQNDIFMAYVPQILALLFLSQMFVSATQVHFQAWYIFGFWYTVTNIINWIFYRWNTYKFSVLIKNWPHTLKYGLHLLIGATGFFYISNGDPSNGDFLALIGTIVVVICLWLIKDIEYSKTGVTLHDFAISNTKVTNDEISLTLNKPVTGDAALDNPNLDEFEFANAQVSKGSIEITLKKIVKTALNQTDLNLEEFVFSEKQDQPNQILFQLKKAVKPNSTDPLEKYQFIDAKAQGDHIKIHLGEPKKEELSKPKPKANSSENSD